MAIAAAAVALALFLGRWVAGLLADRWWTDVAAPAAAPFLANVHILRLVLDAGGVLLASAWFIGHLLVVYRAVGSVQVPRHVANLEFRETLTPRTLLTGAVLVGALFGLLTGGGLGSSWPIVALAWQGVSFAATEPLLSHDIGLYVAQLPLWRTAHGLVLLLVGLALVLVLALYALIGAVRWIDGRPAINDHARRHLGWLLAGFAATLAWGYLLEPYERVAGLPGPVGADTFGKISFVAPALAGVALTATALSALWALRPRHTLVLAGWIVLAGSSVVGHYVVPLFGDRREPAVGAGPGGRRLADLAYGLEAVRETTVIALDTAAPSMLSLWGPGPLAALAADSNNPAAIDAAVLTVGTRRQPVWLVVRGLAGDAGATVAAVADDRVTSVGGPLFFRGGDTLAYPGFVAYDSLPPHAVRPFAPAVDLSRGAQGPLAGNWPRRLLLAWALQEGDLFGAADREVRVGWRLSPESRVAAVAPFAEWSAPRAAYVDGRLVWLADGYLATRTFPLVDTLHWRGRVINGLRAGFVGVVDAATGSTRIFLAERAGPIAQAWARIAAGVVEPASALPTAVSAALRYPPELLTVQARVLGGDPWRAGTPAGLADSAHGSVRPPTLAWRPDLVPSLLVSFEHARGARLGALLEGRPVGEGPLLLRVDSAVEFAAPGTLAARWHRFVTFEQLRDSVTAAGGRLDTGPVRFWLAPHSLGAYEVAYARRRAGVPLVAWVSVAVGPRLGAGRTPAEAWSNLKGATVPLPPGSVRSQVEDARRWLRRADSALRRGDLEGFGRAFDALKTVLEATPDSGK